MCKTIKKHKVRGPSTKNTDPNNAKFQQRKKNPQLPATAVYLADFHFW